MNILSLRNIHKTRRQNAGFALEIARLEVPRGEKIALVGPSGCGKSTALDMLATVLRPDSGESFHFAPAGHSVDILALWEAGKTSALAALRLQHVGYVLQTGGLLPFLSARANILLGCAGGEGASRLSPLAERLGILPLLDSLPGRLSVGERQRVAIARALIRRPALVLADEPTAALDPLNAASVLRLFTALAEETAATVIMVTHAPDAAAAAGFRLVRTTLHREGQTVLARMGDCP